MPLPLDSLGSGEYCFLRALGTEEGRVRGRTTQACFRASDVL
jgi:hypothetical protein